MRPAHASPVAAPDGLRRQLLDWYGTHARELPWRSPTCSPWGVLVSEVMLQQTPVSRVLPVWQRWMARWPDPPALAAATPAAAVAAWDRLGYPRRALRLHAAATTCVDRFDGRVPDTYDELLTLPGVGEYTAAAVASFAFRQRHVVLDTNIRRVLARSFGGEAYEPPGTPTAAERSRAESLLPDDGPTAARWNVALMELGALICSARTPQCDACPLTASCAWHLAGHPAWSGPPRRAQTWTGTDRQARGALMAVARQAYAAGRSATIDEMAHAWPDAEQRTRALAALVTDGLLYQSHGTFHLPEG